MAKVKKIDKEQMLKHFKADLAKSKAAREPVMTKIMKWRDIYDGKPYGNEQEGRSEMISRDAKMTVDWLVPNIVRPFLSSEDIVKLQPSNADSVNKAEAQGQLLNYQFVRKFNRSRFINSSVLTMAKDGTVIAVCGWDKKEKITAKHILEGITGEELLTLKAKEEQGGVRVENLHQDDTTGLFNCKVVEYKTIANQPTAEILQNTHFYNDPESTTMEDSRFCIQEIAYTRSELKQKDKKYSKDGIYENTDAIKDDQEEENDPYRRDLEKGFQKMEFQDKARKKVTVYEYYGEYDIDGDGIVEQIVCTFSGNTILRLQENPYPDGKPPFIMCQFTEEPFLFWGRSLIDSVEDYQQIKTAMLRTFIDTLAYSTNGMKTVPKGLLDTANMRKLREGKIGEVVERNATTVSGAIDLVPTNQIPASFFNFWEMIESQKQNESGVTSYNQGLDAGSLNKTATGITAIMSQSQMRMWQVTYQYSENFLKPLFRKWIAYNSEFLGDGEQMRIEDEFVPIKSDDISGEYDLDINVTLAGVDEAKQGQIVQLLQVSAPMVQAGALPMDVPVKLIQKLTSIMDFKDLSKELSDGIKQRQQQQSGNAGNPQQVPAMGAMSGQPQEPQGLSSFNGVVPNSWQGSPMGLNQNA